MLNQLSRNRLGEILLTVAVLASSADASTATTVLQAGSVTTTVCGPLLAHIVLGHYEANAALKTAQAKLVAKGMSPEEAKAKLAAFRAIAAKNVELPIPLISRMARPIRAKKAAALSVDEYYKLRDFGLDDATATQLAPKLSASDYIALVKADVPEPIRTTAAQLFNSKEFLVLWRSGYKDIPEIETILENMPAAEFVKLKKFVATTADAIKLHDKVEFVDWYVWLRRNSAITSDEAVEVSNEFGKSDIKRYANLRLNHTHKEAIEILNDEE